MPRSRQNWQCDRRTILMGIPAAALAWPMKANSVAADAAPDDPSGVYVARDRALGINPFINDAGERIFLFTDYGSGKVRSLFPQPDGSFTIGPGFATASPVEATLRRPRSDLLTLASIGGEVQRAVRLRTRDIAVSFSQGDATLAGTLILPPGKGPHPAIVLLHGSGPLTRYSFGPYPRFFSSLGLAVLIFDKRGTGASTGTRIDASTGRPDTLTPAMYPDDLRADAVAAVRMLQSRSEIDPRRIGLWGSSEGGMLTTQVAAFAPDIAFIINSAGFMGRLADTILYQGAAKMRAAGKSESEVAQAIDFNRHWMEAGRSGAGFAAFAARRAVVLAEHRDDWLFYEDAAFTSQEQLSWTMKHILDFDSLPDVSKVACPALGLFGEKDVLTDSPRASTAMLHALQAGGNLDATVKVIPNATHSLMEASDRAYMAPGVFETLRTWLLARIKSLPKTRTHIERIG